MLARRTLAICQTCKGRLWQAKETVAENLAEQERFRRENILSIVNTIVSYNCPDDSGSWFLENFFEEVRQKKLAILVVQNKDPYFHIPRVKNLAHRLGIIAGANYLLNLDIDNFVAQEDLKILQELSGKGLAYHGLENMRDGSCGRIGLPVDEFVAAGGYDEACGFSGKHDLKLVEFLKKSVGVSRHNPSKRAIQNSKELTRRFSPNNTAENDSGLLQERAGLDVSLTCRIKGVLYYGSRGVEMEL